MKKYFNIESKTHSGINKGYCAIDKFRTAYDATGRSWIVYGRSGYWAARANVTCQGLESVLIGFETLDEISAELAAIGNEVSK